MTDNNLIQKLRGQGHDTSWYDRGHVVKPDDTSDDTPSTCSRLSLFILQDNNSYTVFSTGAPYKLWKPLKQPVDTPVYFCSGCRARWALWKDALDHLTHLEAV